MVEINGRLIDLLGKFKSRYFAKKYVDKYLIPITEPPQPLRIVKIKIDN
jgi:hypothetical protein